MGCRTILGVVACDSCSDVKVGAAASGQWSSVGGNDDWQRLGGQRSLAAAVRRKSTPFHGVDGAGALRGIGRDSRRRFREAGVSLVELSISLFLVMSIAIFGLQTMMS